MNTIINVSPPLNLSEQHRPLFEPYLSYELEALKVRTMRNVFVTNSGLCLDKNGLVKESHHNYPNQYDNYLAEALHFFHNASDDPEKVIIIDDEKTYLLIHHPWFNYYHWLCEPILRLWLVREKINDMTLILPGYYKDYDFILGSLEPFNISKIFFIPPGKSLIVKKLCLPQIKPICDSYHKEELYQIKDFYQTFAATKTIKSELGQNIYISRHLAKRRKVLNEPEILKVLYKYNFTVFYPEQFSFLEQVSIFSKAKYIVSTHGAGLTNMIFMDKNSSVLELHKSKTNELDRPSFAFWYLADALDHRYFHQICDPENGEPDDYFTGDYVIDTHLFEENLKLMLR